MIKIKKRKIISITFSILLVYCVQFYIDSFISIVKFSKKFFALVRQGDSFRDSKLKGLLAIKEDQYQRNDIFVHSVSAMTVSRSITAPVDGSTVSGASVSVTADATSPLPIDVPISGVQFKLDGFNLGEQDTVFPYGITWDTTGVADGVHSLSCDASTVDYGAKASAAISVTVENPPIRLNKAPTSARSAGTTSSNISLMTNENATCAYSTSVDTPYASMTQFANTGARTIHSTTVTGLSNGSTYSYYVRCQDDSLNVNLDDYIISFSILNTGGDLIAPTVPGSLSVNVVSANQADLSWAASSDIVAVAGYKIYRNDIEIATTTSLSYSDLTINPSTAYQYRVSAYDDFANESALSAAFSIQAPAAAIPISTPVSASVEKKDDEDEVEEPKRQINQSYSKVKRGGEITQTGKRFSKNSMVNLYFSRSNLSYYPPISVKTDKKGAFSVYYIAKKNYGKYKWYAVDLKTGRRSKLMRYEITADITRKQAGYKSSSKGTTKKS
ncbi:MAG: Ig-like domain-containing protein [bacterium]